MPTAEDIGTLHPNGFRLPEIVVAFLMEGRDMGEELREVLSTTMLQDLSQIHAEEWLGDHFADTIDIHLASSDLFDISFRAVLHVNTHLSK